MHLPSNILSRNLRLVLLLLMLAAQGIANAHELCPDHVADHHGCSVCVLGHGLESAVVTASAAPLQIQFSYIQPSFSTIGDVLLPFGKNYSSRAPPMSLRAL